MDLQWQVLSEPRINTNAIRSIFRTKSPPGTAPSAAQRPGDGDWHVTANLTNQASFSWLMTGSILRCHARPFVGLNAAITSAHGRQWRARDIIDVDISARPQFHTLNIYQI
jgi:hypothetical protein